MLPQPASLIQIGTAAWNIPALFAESFPVSGSHLERYAQRLSAVEINSSFYRDHRPETYAKWAAAVPADFRFAVKLSRYFTQHTRLTDAGPRLTEVLAGIAELGKKWGVLLVQLPPSLVFEGETARRFFSALRARYAGPLALEPRHRSWASEAGLALLREFALAKVVADPEPCPLPDPQRLGSEAFLYCRLHGSPEIYRSRYSDELVHQAGDLLLRAAGLGKLAWCIFDNTTFGYATENALALRARLRPDLAPSSSALDPRANRIDALGVSVAPGVRID